jgi:membrane-bound serine protease (ClpP class)
MRIFSPLVFVVGVVAGVLPVAVSAESLNGPVVVLEINGTINPATDDYLKTGLAAAVEQKASLVVVKLNTPGGLLTSMQSMVQALLQSDVATLVYVSPSGASATSAGVFITLAGHVAAMAPGTTIGAAHPVSSGGEDIQGDSRTKVENFAVSLIRAISEQRSRNVLWAEKAVRESVSITDRDAVAEKVIDLIANDLDSLLEQLNGKTVSVNGKPVTLANLKSAPRTSIPMSFKQQVVNVLSDPNIAMFIGLAALAGLGIEFYHPGLILPGVVGAICLILSLTAAQVLPINIGGAALFGLGVLFIIVETLSPGIFIWGVAGVICLVLGSVYLIDTEGLWGLGSYQIDYTSVGGSAALLGVTLLLLGAAAARALRAPVKSGLESLIGQLAVVKEPFRLEGCSSTGRVELNGELWRGKFSGKDLPQPGERLKVTALLDGMVLQVERQ